MTPEALAYPDVETASADYARRFTGLAGVYLLSAQERAVGRMLNCPRPSDLLEIGGGHGQLLDLYARLNIRVILHGSSTVCFDRLPANQRDRLRLVVSPPHEIPLADKSVDTVVCVRMLAHTEQWKALIREMCRIARQSVVIDYPSNRSLNALTPVMFFIKKVVEKNTRPYQSFSRKAPGAIFRENGFALYSERPLFFLPMVIHRMGGGRFPLRLSETVFRAIGLVWMFGSPVIARAKVPGETIE